MSKDIDNEKPSSDGKADADSSQSNNELSFLGKIFYKSRRLFRQLLDAHIIKKRLDKHKSVVSEECETDDGYAKYTLIFRILVALLVTTLLRAAVVGLFFNTDKFSPSSIYYTVQDILYFNSYSETPAEVLNYSRSDMGSAFALYKSGLVSVGSSEVKIFNATGRVTLTSGDIYSDPAIVTSDRHILIYDVGGYRFSIYNSFKKLRTERLDGRIAFASMCEDGGFVVVAKTSDYNSEVYRYSAECELLGTFKTSQYVISAPVSQNGRYTAVLSTTAGDGRMISKITVLRLGREEKFAEISLGGLDPYTCEFVDDDRIAVYCSDRLMIFDHKGNVVNEVIYPDAAISRFSSSYGEGIALLFEVDLVLGENRLIFTDEDGDVIYNGSLKGNFTDMAVYDEDIYLLSNNGFYRFDTGSRVCIYTKEENTFGKLLICGREKILLCTDSEGIYYKVR